MLRIRRTLLLILILLAASMAMALYYLIEEKPRVQVKWTLSQADIDRAKEIVHLNAPKNATEGAIHTLSLTEKDLNIAADYLLNRFAESATRIKVADQELRFSASITLPRNPFGGYLNVHFIVRNGPSRPTLTKLEIGRIQIPGDYADSLVQTTIRHSPLGQYYLLADEHVKAIQFHPRSVDITYRWNAAAFERARSFFTADADGAALHIYHNKLVEILAAEELPRHISIKLLLRPLFALAHQRTAAGADAVAENHALLLVLAAYLNHQPFDSLIGYGKPAPKPARKIVMLHWRADTALHFITSAALAAGGDDLFADIVGLRKEVGDARHGTGFSFVDLAADRAGTRFGRMAAASAESAIKLQEVMRDAAGEKVFMPDARDLPEGLDKAAFKAAYGGTDTPAYQKMVALIDSRIDACLLYRI